LRATILYPVDERAVGPYYQMPSQFLLFLPLTIENPRGELEGRLARHWEHSPDYRTWTITLRDDVRWHDGMPVTAHDIKFTLDLMSHPKVLRHPPGASIVTVRDASTCTISYSRRVTDPLSSYTVYYPKHLLEQLDPGEFYQWPFWTRPVGNGPYRYVRHAPHMMMELEANPDYFRGKPKIEHVVLQFGREFGEAASLTDLLSGAVDAATYVSRTDVPKVRGDRRFRVYFHIQPDNLQTILWNRQARVFRDPGVRRALTLAIDRRELNRLLDLPEEIPIVDALFTERQFRRGDLPPSLPHDPGEAKRLLDAAGWRGADGSDRRDGEGRVLRFTALTTQLQDLEKAAVYVQAQLRRIGVVMEIQSADLASMRARVMAGRFEAAFFPIYSDGEYGHHAMFGSGSPLGPSDPRVVELLEFAQRVVDPAEVDETYRRLAPFFAADIPATLLYPSVWTHVVHRRVRGLSSPWHAEPVWYLEDLWLDDRDEPR
jgi:peptide/nickel transport system substrate-binding protein